MARKLPLASSLRAIEKTWCAPMGNSMETRIRFAIWWTMRYAAKLGTREKIEVALEKDQALFDDGGERRKHGA